MKKNEAVKASARGLSQNLETGGVGAQTTDNLRPWWHGFTSHPSRLAPVWKKSCESRTLAGLRFENLHGPYCEPKA